MLKKSLYILFFIAFASEGIAQKILEREWNSDGIETIVIRSDAAYQISISSEKTDKIEVLAEVAGENYEHLVLASKRDTNTLTIETSFSPYFTAKNDKLAAHKVMAIEIKLRIPESMTVKVESKLASVIAEGSYRSLDISLELGNCDLKNFNGNARLLTKKGDINVSALLGVAGKASSLHGIVENKLSQKGKLLIEAESIYGNIRLLQTK